MVTIQNFHYSLFFKFFFREKEENFQEISFFYITYTWIRDLNSLKANWKSFNKFFERLHTVSAKKKSFLSFAYKENPVLAHNFSFSTHLSQTTSIISPTPLENWAARASALAPPQIREKPTEEFSTHTSKCCGICFNWWRHIESFITKFSSEKWKFSLINRWNFRKIV